MLTTECPKDAASNAADDDDMVYNLIVIKCGCIFSHRRRRLLIKFLLKVLVSEFSVAHQTATSVLCHAVVVAYLGLGGK